MRCDVCCRNMTAPDGITYIGVKIQATPADDVDESVLQWLTKYMKPYEDRVYAICFPCFLGALGVSPEPGQQQALSPLGAHRKRRRKLGRSSHL